MSEDWKNHELRNKYKKEKNKLPLYADLPTDDYKKWLNQKDMRKAIQRVIDEEKNQNKEG